MHSYAPVCIRISCIQAQTAFTTDVDWEHYTVEKGCSPVDVKVVRKLTAAKTSAITNSSSNDGNGGNNDDEIKLLETIKELKQPTAAATTTYVYIRLYVYLYIHSQ